MIFRMIGSGAGFQEILYTLILVSLAMLFALPIHEFAHAFVAYKLGDRAQKAQGRLTLNPLKHLDPLGTVSLLLTGFGWAKPVYVNSSALKKGGKYAGALVSLAGPLSNILLGTVFCLLYLLSRKYLGFFVHGSGMFVGLIGVFVEFLDIAFIISINLAVINLIPVPPFDGFGIISPFLSHRIHYYVHMYSTQISIVFLLLLISGFLTIPIMTVSQFLQNAIKSMIGFIV